MLFANQLRGVTPGPFAAEKADETCAASLPDHLKSLFERSIDNLLEEQHAEVTALLVDCKDVISKGPEVLDVPKAFITKLTPGMQHPFSKYLGEFVLPRGRKLIKQWKK